MSKLAKNAVVKINDMVIGQVESVTVTEKPESNSGLTARELDWSPKTVEFNVRLIRTTKAGKRVEKLLKKGKRK